MILDSSAVVDAVHRSRCRAGAASPLAHRSVQRTPHLQPCSMLNNSATETSGPPQATGGPKVITDGIQMTRSRMTVNVSPLVGGALFASSPTNAEMRAV